ncbi:MAG: DUF4105 domain-containing protein [Bacteroidota bacterium]|nr:DUF4105 domain-containing protein [Bacteroidota bacterium]MDP4211964.1 DUF4105 domain-containing protein [Bacteroidota bacterium]MDP4250078.1 DUF4105 domain-containing protein [Bacteroidota bacterium]
MRKRIVPWIAFPFLLFCSINGTAQNPDDSCTLEISLLTCAPGTDLYSLFGHTAIRVRDQRRGMDVVYNYGTFDDSDPLFYVHFTNGIMLYSVSASTFEDFMSEYEYEHRGVVAQILDLTCEQKKNLYEALRQNTTEDKRFYNYQFYADNCTTRAGKMIVSHSQPLRIENILPSPSPTYRQMIHVYLERQHQYWPEFGIDMLLGSNLDKKPGNEQAMYFLPDYLMNGIDHARKATGPLVRKKETLLQFAEVKTGSSGITPAMVFGFLFVLSIILSVIRKNTAQKTLQVFDIALFSLLGLFGVVILYVWIFRVDEVCRNNINIFWALPTHLAAVFFLRKNPSWLKSYFLITAGLSAVLLVGFIWWPQQMNSAVAVLLLLMVFRSFHQFLKLRNAKNDHLPAAKSGL